MKTKTAFNVGACVLGASVLLTGVAEDRPWITAEELARVQRSVVEIDFQPGTPETDATVFWRDAAKTSGVRANYDEAKAGVLNVDYTLEDPLTFADGRRVKNAAEWPARRAELLALFEQKEYGRMPPKPETNGIELISEKLTEDRFAFERRYRQWFRADKTGPCIDWLVYVPRYAKGRVPVILHLNYRGNDHIAKTWKTNHYNLPIDIMVARGYAFMTAHYQQITCDPKTDEDWKNRVFNGVFALWGKRDPKAKDNTGALMAWAWGLCRGLDLAETLPEIDAQRSVVTGSSRLGKAALLAGAYDTRFAVVAPNQTGGGGVQIMKRNYGETSKMMHLSLPHWFCAAYWDYEDDPRQQPFDQHLLLACVAPRNLLLECYHKKWFDPKGEFISAQAASPVWELLTGRGLACRTTPPEPYSDVAVKPPFGYARRTECHGLASWDWLWTMDFADRAWARAAKGD